MSYYKINSEKKTITIDDAVKSTASDEKDINRYVAAGYVIKHKSKKRAKAASDRADNLKDADIKAAWKDEPEKLAEYEKIKHEKGFFSARKYFKEQQK